jgi:hypothetical protein
MCLYACSYLCFALSYVQLNDCQKQISTVFFRYVRSLIIHSVHTIGAVSVVAARLPSVVLIRPLRADVGLFSVRLHSFWASFSPRHAASKTKRPPPHALTHSLSSPPIFSPPFRRVFKSISYFSASRLFLLLCSMSETGTASRDTRSNTQYGGHNSRRLQSAWDMAAGCLYFAS